MSQGWGWGWEGCKAGPGPTCSLMEVEPDTACCLLLWLEEPAGPMTMMERASLLLDMRAAQSCCNAGDCWPCNSPWIQAKDWVQMITIF